MKFLLGQSNCFMEPFIRRYKLKIAICVTIELNRFIGAQCKKYFASDAL